MKRSEMVQIIEEYLCCDGVLTYSYPPHEVTFDDYQIENIAKNILEICEKTGMLPPPFTCVNEDDKTTTEFGSCKVYEWEPEDVDSET